MAEHRSSSNHDTGSIGDAETGVRSYNESRPMRPAYRGSANSEDTIRATATPPIDIPAPTEEAIAEDGLGGDLYMQQYIRNRQPSVSFHDEVKLDSGHSQSIHEPLEKPAKDRPRGRSMLQAMQDERSKANRAHSETDREHFDPMTGRYLPRYSTSPPREEAKIGEGRFPLLQTTVDAMARDSQIDLSQPMSLTSESTISPRDEVHTPHNEVNYPIPTKLDTSPFTGQAAFSYEEPKEFKRTASQRWREGQHSASAQDFFSRAGSLRQGARTFSSGRLSRRDTNNSTRSPRSAASSFLRGFSLSSSTSDGADAGPPAVDAEGQTIGEDYVLGKQIGYGGFSVIKEVTQMREGRQRKLAVKIVRRQISGKSEADNDHAQAEFEHEVELWRFLDHQHILPLEAVYKLDEATFCFIPLNTGGTLFDLVRSNRQGLPLELAASYIYQLAAALRYLHLDARVVHRDIKLENVLLERDPKNADSPGLIRICDFGMAEWLSRESDSSSSDPPSPNINEADRPPQRPYGPADSSTSAFAGGSLEYAAPEILRLTEARSKSSSNADSSVEGAERSVVSAAVDIWAFGACVYTLLVGSRPFQNSFQPRVVMAILAGDYDTERLAVKAGPDALELTQGCLEMDENRRWNIAEVLDCAFLADAANRAVDEEGSISAWKL